MVKETIFSDEALTKIYYTIKLKDSRKNDFEGVLTKQNIYNMPLHMVILIFSKRKNYQ